MTRSGVQEPTVFLFDGDGGEARAASDLARRLDDLGVETPFVLTSKHGAGIGSVVMEDAPHEVPGRTDQDGAMELGSRAKRLGADSIVAIGGGRLLDVGKLAAARAGLTLVVVPTQLSHDGICSPVAVVPNDEGKTESLGAIEPRAVYLSMPTLIGAPVASLAAGIGDLLANPLALKDWALAAERGLDEIDRRAWDLSVQAFQTVEDHLDRPAVESAQDPEFIKLLAQALILSGVSMLHAGTSRPASGGEHEISHAIDQLYGGRGMHGAQVAFSCIVSVALYEEDFSGFRARLDRIGLPSHPSQLELDEDDMVKILLEAPETRPGRFTIVEEANLDAGTARALVKRIWP